MSSYYVGVDVGTSSIRVAVASSVGEIVCSKEENISIHNPKPGYYEQASEEIWSKCCDLIKTVTKDLPKEQIKGIGFDATCSLVVLDAQFQPVSIGGICTLPEKCYNIIMWMDHRAEKQADAINSTKHEILKYVGGKMSLEMQPPKLLWLKQMNEPSWVKASNFFDLPDLLTFKATGSLSRSLCSLTCKWGYVPQHGWVKDFWSGIGLNDLADDNFKKIGNEIKMPGDPVGSGLSQEAAGAMNLLPGTPVGTSIIDGHCGGIGCIAGNIGSVFPNDDLPMTKRLVLICGTSSCHMAISEQPTFVTGVWGPYLSAMVPNLWLNEGGQSATGKLIDHIIDSHPALTELEKLALERKEHKHLHLNHVLETIAASQNMTHVDLLTKNIHIWPDFHGNRSPLADSSLCGMICGLTLDNSLKNLAKLYLAALQALANGTRHIVDEMERAGHRIAAVFMCGGLSKNPLFVQIHSNVLGKPIILSEESETVLLGSCILGARASGDFMSLEDAMKSMSRCGKVVHQNSATTDFYDKKYKVFLKMLDHQLEYKTLML